MHYAIIEDLEMDRKHLSDLIREDGFRYGENVELSCYQDGEAFLEDFRKGLFSAVFLDILLGNGKITGIETATQIRERDERLPIIFTTTETSFALASYRVHPLDYLIKPVKEQELSWCLKELRDYLAAPAWFEVQVSSGQGAATSTCHILLDEFVYAETMRHGLALYTLSGVTATRLSLAELTAILPENGRFYISGRGHLINFSQVSAIENTGKILFKDNRTIFCSRRKIRETQRAFWEYTASVMRNTLPAKRFLMEHEAGANEKELCTEKGDGC
ncbi:MAG: LytTR family DNA-binding domain-containing protein [bacterium]|nr:LytTR family DNA-binding domain-containing protein [bacterium]